MEHTSPVVRRNHRKNMGVMTQRIVHQLQRISWRVPRAFWKRSDRYLWGLSFYQWSQFWPGHNSPYSYPGLSIVTNLQTSRETLVLDKDHAGNGINDIAFQRSNPQTWIVSIRLSGRWRPTYTIDENNPTELTHRHPRVRIDAGSGNELILPSNTAPGRSNLTFRHHEHDRHTLEMAYEGQAFDIGQTDWNRLEGWFEEQLERATYGDNFWITLDFEAGEGNPLPPGEIIEAGPAEPVTYYDVSWEGSRRPVHRENITEQVPPAPTEEEQPQWYLAKLPWIADIPLGLAGMVAQADAWQNAFASAVLRAGTAPIRWQIKSWNAIIEAAGAPRSSDLDALEESIGYLTSPEAIRAAKVVAGLILVGSRNPKLALMGVPAVGFGVQLGGKAVQKLVKDGFDGVWLPFVNQWKNSAEEATEEQIEELAEGTLSEDEIAEIDQAVDQVVTEIKEGWGRTIAPWLQEKRKSQEGAIEE